jgi:hypothetical protein
LYYGYAGLVDGVLERMIEEAEASQNHRHGRTGATDCDRAIYRKVDDTLTLEG